MSDVDGVLDEVVSEANVFDRGRKGEDEVGDVGGEVEELENAGWDGERVADASEAAEWDRDEIGTVRFCKL